VPSALGLTLNPQKSASGQMSAMAKATAWDGLADEASIIWDIDESFDLGIIKKRIGRQ
jgi:hypothetical protein